MPASLNLHAAIFAENRWIDELFADYDIYPVIFDAKLAEHPLSDDTLFSRLTRIFLADIKLATILNTLAGLSLFSKDSGPSAIVKAYEAIRQNTELGTTLRDRVKRAYRRAAKSNSAYSSIHKGAIVRYDDKYLRSFLSAGPSTNGRFVVVPGILSRIAKMKDFGSLALAKSLRTCPTPWMISDEPYFATDSEDFKNTIVLLDIDQQFLAALDEVLPFFSNIGWYPYVRIYGVARTQFDIQHNYPAIRVAFMEIRRPKNYAQVQTVVERAYDEDSGVADSGFSVDRENYYDIFAFKDVCVLLAQADHLNVEDIPYLKERYDNALKRLSTLAQTKLRQNLNLA